MPVNKEYNCLVVLGPTASGKTSLACGLALQLNGEVISADSRQVYRGLDIGTGKDLHTFTAGGKPIPYHLIDIADTREQFFLHDFIRELAAAFDAITRRSRLPVICGGTGLYLDALRKDFSLTQVPEDQELRNKLRSMSKNELLHRLTNYPVAHVSQVDKTSVKRMIRGIEIAEYLSKKEISVFSNSPAYRPFYIGIHPPRHKVIENISRRLDARLATGMVEEVQRLLASGVSHERMQQLGLEYRYVSLYLQGRLNKAEMREKLFVAIRQFARRQMTWFRRMEKEGVPIYWLETPAIPTELIRHLKPIFPHHRGPFHS